MKEKFTCMCKRNYGREEKINIAIFFFFTGHSSQLEEDNEQTSPLFPCNHTRSKTNASPELSPRSKARYSVSKAPNTDRLRNAKIMAEKAMKVN